MVDQDNKTKREKPMPGKPRIEHYSELESWRSVATIILLIWLSASSWIIFVYLGNPYDISITQSITICMG